MKYILFPILAVAALAFTACSDNDNENGHGSGIAYETITLKNGIYNSNTRAISQELQEYKFDAGRPIGVFVTGVGTESGYGYSNVQLITDGKDGFTGTTMYYPTEGSIVLNSYGPYNAEYTLNEPQIFTVSTDQSNDEDYINSDLLYAEATADKYDATVTMKYYHQLEKVDINIHGDLDEVLGDTLTLLNLCTSAWFYPSTGEVTAISGSEADILTAKYHNVADGTEYLTSSTIVVPQDLSNFTVTIGEYSYTCSTNVDGEGGERYSFNATVEKGKYVGILNYDGIISNWEDADLEDYIIYDYVFSLDDINPSIYGDGSWDAATSTLTTSAYGFGGWQFNPALDLSKYKYLIVEVGDNTDMTGGVRLRLYDEDNYWGTPANFIISDNTTVIDLNNQSVDDPDNEGFAPIDPSHIYMAGFWTFGSDCPVQIKKIYATTTLPDGYENNSGDNNNDEDNGDDNSNGEISGDDYVFSLSNIDPSIWTDGSFESSTNTLITGEYGFGGWQFYPALDLSAYKYLVVKVSEGTSLYGGVRFRMFDENNYWSTPANFLITDYQTVIDLNNQAVDDPDNEGYKAIDPSHIYIAGFWTYGGADNAVVIDKIYATNTYPNN